MVGILLLVVFTTTACSLASLGPNRCDDPNEEAYLLKPSCTPDGKLLTKQSTGCNEQDGPTYTTTTIECGAGEVCAGSRCQRPCATNDDCPFVDFPWCGEWGYCLPPLTSGAPCSDRSWCADGLECLPGDVEIPVSRPSKPSNPFAGFDDPEFDGGAVVPVLPHCAETFARGNECACQ